MKIETLSTKENGVTRFRVQGTTAAMLNLYRRMIVTDVPCLAIDTVEIQENSSAMYDEMLAHRLGLVVLGTDLDACFVKDAKKFTVKLTLEAEGPKTVVAGDMQSKDKGALPVHSDTIITKLLEGQRVKLIATATIGVGAEHVKYSPGTLFYQHYPNVAAKDKSKVDAIAAACPVCSNGKKAVHELCMACLGRVEDEGLSSTKDDDFLVTVEPWGQFNAKDLLEATGKVVDMQLDALQGVLKK